MQTWFPRAAGGDAEAAEKVLRILDRQARLLGLDIPVPKDAHLTIEQMPNIKVDWAVPAETDGSDDD